MNSPSFVGIDIGSQTALIAVAKKGGVEILANEASQRETPVVVGFGDYERFIGELGYAQLKSNFKNTVQFPMRFLGLAPNSPLLENEKKWLYCPVVPYSDNQIAFEVNYRGEKRKFLPEQVVGMMLQKIKHTLKANGASTNDMVITVPTYFTQQEKKALLNAARIAEINVLKLLNESTAKIVALSYGLFRLSELSDKPRYVGFVDVGHANASAFVVAFTKEKLTIMNQHSERNLGTRDFDWKMLEYYVNKIEKEMGVNVIKKEKIRLRMLEAIEKQRKVLSANSEASINVDCVAEDYDLSHTLSREEYEKINAEHLQKFRDLLVKLKSELKVKLHSIEIVGGGTRMPSLQKIIQEIFGMECSRTLHSTECISRGAAIQAAMFNPLSKVSNYLIEESNYHPIRASWAFTHRKGSKPGIETTQDIPNSSENQTVILFEKGCTLPRARALEMPRVAPCIEIKLTYDPPVQGFDPLLSQIYVFPVLPKEASFVNKVRVALNDNGMIEVDQAQMLEEYVEDPLVPGSKPEEKKEAGLADKVLNFFTNTEKGWSEKFRSLWNSEEEDQLKKRRKARVTELETQVNFEEPLTSQQIIQLVKEENAMLDCDKHAVETAEKKNELEAYIYDSKNKLNDVYSGYIDAEMKQFILNELDKTNQWLYGEGARASKGEYANKLEELKTLIQPLNERYKKGKTVMEALDDFSAKVTQFENKILPEIQKCKDLPPSEMENILRQLNEDRNWIAEKKKTGDVIPIEIAKRAEKSINVEKENSE